MHRLETYNPRKKFSEIMKSLSKPVAKILLLILILAVTIILTKMVVKNNFEPQIIFKSSGKITSGENFNSIQQTTLTSVLSKDDLVKDLPESSSVKLIIGDKNYLFENNEIRESKKDSEIELIIPEEYSSYFKDLTICETLNLANKNGDLEVKTELSETTLALKYHSLVKYKSCFDLG